jgi:hypothetical protein
MRQPAPAGPALAAQRAASALKSSRMPRQRSRPKPADSRARFESSGRISEGISTISVESTPIARDFNGNADDAEFAGPRQIVPIPL